MNRHSAGGVLAVAATIWLTASASAQSVTIFSTGNPNGLIGTLSRTPGAGGIETETADDFVLGQNALITGATFVGLLPTGASLSTIKDVEIELYHVFPADSTNPPDGNVPTRVNSPSDINFGATFDFGNCTKNCTATILSSSFSAANSVVSGIHPIPNQTTSGEGPVSGEEVLFTVTFNPPFFVGATDHDFFRPEVGLSSGNFLWLSAPKPIVSPGTPFSSDLQAWIRNANLEPDWLRIGTDIVGGVPAPTYNMTFSLTAGTPAFPAFFNGEVSLGSGVYYLQFPNGNLFGYHNLTNFPIFYHYDMGFEAFIDGGNGAAYMYDFTSGHWWYTTSSLFPYLYDFTLNNWLYYLPNTTNPGHYTTNPRYFSDLTTGKIITM